MKNKIKNKMKNKMFFYIKSKKKLKNFNKIIFNL